MASSALTAVPLVVSFLSPLAPEHERTLLDACSLAHEHGKCVSQDSGESSTLHATVDMAPDRVLLEVTQSFETRQVFVSREVTFQPGDADAERARSVGLALGVLATSLTERPPKEEAPGTPPESEEPRAAEDRPPNEVLESLPRSTWGAGLGAELIPSWRRVGPALEMRAQVRVTSHLSFALRARGALFAGSTGTPSITTLSPLMGIGFVVPAGQAFVSAHASGGFEYLRARVESSISRGAGARLAPALGADFTWATPLGEKAWLYVSPTFAAILSETRLYVDDSPQGTTGNFRVGVHAGLLWSPD